MLWKTHSTCRIESDLLTIVSKAWWKPLPLSSLSSGYAGFLSVPETHRTHCPQDFCTCHSLCRLWQLLTPVLSWLTLFHHWVLHQETPVSGRSALTSTAGCSPTPISPLSQFCCLLISSFTAWLLRQWHPTPVLLPGKSHGQRSLVGCSPWGREESDRTEGLHFHFSLSCIGEGNGNPLQCSCLENPRDGGAW